MRTRTRTAAAAAGTALLVLLAGCGLLGQDSNGNPGDIGDSNVPTASVSSGPCSPAGSSPRFIAIIGQGVTSHIGTGTAPVSLNPAKVSFCTSTNGTSPPNNPQLLLRDFADGWMNWKCDAGPTGPYVKDNPSTVSYPHDLIDALAQAGGYVLPYSYKGATMSGTQQNPTFTFKPYTGDDVGSTDPLTTGTAMLQGEISSIHSVFPNTPIVVAAHSNGGLVAEQWWLQYGQHKPDGVVQVFSLDSPLNGVASGWFCVVPNPENGWKGICGGTVGQELGAIYRVLWDRQARDDQTELAIDAKDHLFTAIGDFGDPLYDVGDYKASHKFGINGGNKNIGLMSQMYWTEPQCEQSGFDMTQPACTVTGQGILNPCGGHNLDDGTGPVFRTPGHLWLHSLVKNCPGTISDVLAWATGQGTPSTPTPTVSPSCTAFGPGCPDGPASCAPTCSPPASSSPPPSQAGTPTPGFDTPADTVAGFFGGDLAGDWTGVCSHVVPSEQAVCDAGVAGNTAAATGNFTIVKTVAHGTEALVAVTGQICVPGGQPAACASNHDPSTGMPSSAGGFQAAYRAAVAAAASGTEVVISPVPCTEIGGRWYITFI